MIIYKPMKKKGRPYIKAYSDEDRYVIVDGIEYGVFCYPADEIHQITEGDYFDETE